MNRLWIALLLVPAYDEPSPAKSEPAATAPAKAEDEKKAAEAAAIAAENAAPPPPKKQPEPSRFEATVNLTFTGAVERTFEGPVGICGATFIDGKVQGGNYGVRTEGFNFQILAATDEELDKPTILLNLSGAERKSFVRRPGQGSVSIDIAKGATVDAELKDIVGSQTVRVKGSITCGPNYR